MRRDTALTLGTVGALATVIAILLYMGAYTQTAWIVCTVTTLTAAWLGLCKFYDERRVQLLNDIQVEQAKKVFELEAAVAEMRNKIGQLDLSLGRKR